MSPRGETPQSDIQQAPDRRRHAYSGDGLHGGDGLAIELRRLLAIEFGGQMLG